MKYIFAGVGMLIGQLVGDVIADSRIVSWTIGVILGLVGYEIPLFFKYLRFSPKQQLSFHGPDSPITRTTSSGEIRSFLSQFHKCGLLIGFDPRQSHVKLDENQWAALSESEKITLCQVLTRATIVDGGHAPPTLRMTDRAGSTLALYSTTDKRLDKQTNFLNSENPPCTQCGSTQKDLRINVADNIGVSEYMSAVGKKDQKTVGFRESERNGRIATADQNKDGLLSYSIKGTSPQGEEDTLPVCKILVQTLNEAGGNWAQPKEGEDVEDCIAIDKTDQRNILRIQVVRAITDENLWRQLSEKGRLYQSDISKDVLLAQLKSSVEKKADNRKIPASIRPTLLLVLDATRLPVLCFEDVIQEYLERHGSWTRSQGFQSVWLVGPIPSLTWRLDSQRN